MKEQFRNSASLIGDPVRVTILWSLLDGKSLTATELAMAADTSASNISMHLAKLLNAGLLKAEQFGRHRYYSFSGKEIAYAVESLAVLFSYPLKQVNHAASVPPALQQCRTCYDHLAGKTGVAITDAMLKQKLISGGEQDFTLFPKGKRWFEEMGIDTDGLQQQRRSFLRPCLDWSERRYHMAGSLPAALLNKMLKDDWIRKTKNSRAVVVTATGQKILYEKLRVIL